MYIGKLPLHEICLYVKITSVNLGVQFEKDAIKALRDQLPVRDLSGVRIRAVKAQPEDTFDRTIRT
jgi:hypothetical protein